MDEELIGLGGYLSLKSKISQLERENEILKAEIERLKQVSGNQEFTEKPKRRKIKSLIVKLRNENYSYKEIMDKTGFSYDYIRKACAEHGLTKPKV